MRRFHFTRPKRLYHSTFLVGYWIFGSYKIATVFKAGAMPLPWGLPDASRYAREVDRCLGGGNKLKLKKRIALGSF